MYFFDYANLERPILFYMYDYEAYREEMKDFYFGIELLPGPVIKEERDISEDVERLLEGFVVDDTYRRFNENFNPHREVCGDRMVREIIKIRKIWKKSRIRGPQKLIVRNLNILLKRYFTTRRMQWALEVF